MKHFRWEFFCSLQITIVTIALENDFMMHVCLRVYACVCMYIFTSISKFWKNMSILILDVYGIWSHLQNTNEVLKTKQCQGLVNVF